MRFISIIVWGKNNTVANTYLLIELYINIGSTFSKAPRRAPYLYDWLINLYKLTISFRLSPINPEDAQGRLLGYTLTYVAVDNLNYNNSRTILVGPNTTRITLRNLKEGSTYTIAIAGFTRKGNGTYRTFSATRKFKCYLYRKCRVTLLKQERRETNKHITNKYYSTRSNTAQIWSW